jgi:hypothetical protein
MKRAHPEVNPLCPEVYAELDKHLAAIDKKRLPQQLRGLRGVFETFALLLKKDASELQKEVEQKLKQMLPEANSYEFEDYVAMIANCNQVAIIIHSVAGGVYKTLPLAGALEAGRPGPMTSLHVALCQTGTEYYVHPVVPNKGKERADLPSASLSDAGGEEEEELQGERSLNHINWSITTSAAGPPFPSVFSLQTKKKSWTLRISTQATCRPTAISAFKSTSSACPPWLPATSRFRTISIKSCCASLKGMYWGVTLILSAPSPPHPHYALTFEYVCGLVCLWSILHLN